MTPPASLKTCFAVYFALLALLGLTYAASLADLGAFNYAIAAAIALAKAALVAAYFMHLREGDSLNGVAFGTGVLWLGILLALTLSDYATRGWLYKPQPW
jgi:cytochrome c oxidase subunit 4